MRNLLIISWGSFLLLLTSCATTQYVPATRADSVLVAAGFPARLKARTAIIQAGTGNVANADDNRKAGQHQGSAATAPDASATNASRRTGGGVPWYIWAAVAILGACAWEFVSSRFNSWFRLPWRQGTG